MDIRSLCHSRKDIDGSSQNQLQPNKRPRPEVEHNLSSSKIARFEKQPTPNIHDEQQLWQYGQSTNEVAEGGKAVAVVEEICLGLVRLVLLDSKYVGRFANWFTADCRSLSSF